MANFKGYLDSKPIFNPKLIKNTFDLHQEALYKKLHQSISQVHFSIDMWTASDAKTVYQAIVTFRHK
jgi:hypothetical protein